MIRLPAPTVTWQESHQTRTVALNVGGRYMTLAVELVLGLLMLPINVGRHCGPQPVAAGRGYGRSAIDGEFRRVE